MIKMVVFDIDGILTDNTVIIDENGKEHKRVNYKDMDAVFELHRQGFHLAAITGENSGLTAWFSRRFPWDYFYPGNKHKEETLRRLAVDSGISLKEMCFIGEGKYDVEALAHVKLGVCPQDAIDEAKQAAAVVLHRNGGCGCVWELVRLLNRVRLGDSPEQAFYERLWERQELFKRLAAEPDLSTTTAKAGAYLGDTMKRQGRVFLCGTGESALDAGYAASVFRAACRGAFIECLDGGTLSLARQMESRAQKGDALVAFLAETETGDAADLLEHAGRIGIAVILLTGSRGRQFRVPEFPDYVIEIPTGNVHWMREGSLFFSCLLAEYAQARFKKAEIETSLPG